MTIANLRDLGIVGICLIGAIEQMYVWIQRSKNAREHKKHIEELFKNGNIVTDKMEGEFNE